MRIELLFVLLMFASCGSISKNVEVGSYRDVQEERFEHTKMADLSSLNWKDSSKKKILITEKQIEYSDPDSTGKQHAVKETIREAKIVSVDSSMIEFADTAVTETIKYEDKDIIEEVEERKDVRVFDFKVIFGIFFFLLFIVVYACRRAR